MWPHLDWSVTPWQIVVALWLFRVDRRISQFMLEHEVLVRDYCDRHNIEVKDFMPRLKVPKWI